MANEQGPVNVRQLCLQLKPILSSKADKIYTAGEKEHIAGKERMKTGIPINKNLQQDIKIMKEELGLNIYDFPF